MAADHPESADRRVECDASADGERLEDVVGAERAGAVQAGGVHI